MEKAQKAYQQKQFAYLIQEALEGLSSINHPASLTQFFNELLVRTLESIQRLDSNQEQTRLMLEAAKELAQQPTKAKSVHTATTDEEIKEQQGTILKTIEALTIALENNMLSESKVREWRGPLQKAYLDIEINAHRHRARVAKEKGQHNIAITHLRIVLNKLTQQVNPSTEQRKDMEDVKNQISDLMSEAVKAHAKKKTANPE